MASADEQLRRRIDDERHQLAEALDDLRGEADVGAKLRGALPVAAAAALGAGFVFGGGVGATMRLLARRSRELPNDDGAAHAHVGRFELFRRAD